MKQFDIYQFILCAFVFTLLTVLFTILVVWLVKLTLRGINAGLDDEKIKAEYLKSRTKKPLVIVKILDRLFLGVCCIALFVAFAMSLSVSFSCSGKRTTGFLPSMNVVQSGSMSYINEKHKFLQQGEVTDQLQRFDLVFIGEPPAEKDLKVNDIVVYEYKGYFIIHRIVAIEEPNDKHPNERHFLLQGDANEIADSFPVLYDQIKGIYTGARIPFIGSFVLFMQSPAGWLCVLLVVFAIIATPLAEKALEKARNARLAAMGLLDGDLSVKIEANADGAEQTAQTEPQAEESAPEPTSEPVPDVLTEAQDEAAATQTEDESKSGFPFSLSRSNKSFVQKLAEAPERTKRAYGELLGLLCRIEKVRLIRSFKGETYKKGNTPICKLTIRGKTLNAYLALDPMELADSKYIYEDVSAVKAYRSYPMRVKLTSDRQVKWVKELLALLVKKYGLTLVEEPVPQEELIEEQPVCEESVATQTEDEGKSGFPFALSRSNKSFVQKLAEAPERTKHAYDGLLGTLCRIEKVRLIRSFKGETYKKGNTPICKLTIRGKTLNAYLALDPMEFADSKYIYEDVSERKAYLRYPMRVKLTSDRQVRWTKELIEILAGKQGLELAAVPITKAELFASLKKTKTFAYKLRKAGEPLKSRYKDVIAFIQGLGKTRVIRGKKGETCKKGNVRLCKLTIRGKTLNVYVALPPEQYVDTKYIYTDVSSVKAYIHYPMRVKLTSARQVKWVKELLTDAANGKGGKA